MNDIGITLWIREPAFIIGSKLYVSPSIMYPYKGELVEFIISRIESWEKQSIGNGLYKLSVKTEAPEPTDIIMNDKMINAFENQWQLGSKIIRIAANLSGKEQHAIVDELKLVPLTQHRISENG